MMSYTRFYVESTYTLIIQERKRVTVHKGRNPGPIFRRFLEVYKMVKKNFTSGEITPVDISNDLIFEIPKRFRVSLISKLDIKCTLRTPSPPLCVEGLLYTKLYSLKV